MCKRGRDARDTKTALFNGLPGLGPSRQARHEYSSNMLT